ncbi:MAG: hypothetical protein GEU73_14260 [Chloroflexi bacterium]|nr:hypothetical protein [Chloroflexota bacterium]
MGRPDAETFTRVDLWLRLGSSPGPVGVPEWAVHDESVTYAAKGAGPGEGAGRGGRSHGVDRAGKTVFLEALLAGRAQGRTSPEQITYSERGNVQGAQFFAVAGAAYEAARAAGLGHELPNDWLTQTIRD